jgi:hypothetical protein
MSVLS